MTEDTLTGYQKLGARVFKPALVLALVGAMTGIVGWLANRRGDVVIGDGLMTAAGVATGVGVTAALFAWAGYRVGRRLESASGRRDREQAARVWQLTILPMAMLAMTAAAMLAAERMVHGAADGLEWATAAVPALYALLLPVMVMNWDAHARKMRKYLDDELIRAMQARAIIAAFFVLMTGACGVYLLGLWRADWAVIALPAVLWAAASTASLRFAWLSRSYDG
ncbi:hypothetical protein [Brevundimonas fluminis]|uniref:hypothetical protein n=1 Tax=Brevundimonas fluminis TaxID=2487274 RepID=UPI000F65641E|nr:hypothetical protein [Brevundimonas fluminis]